MLLDEELQEVEPNDGIDNYGEITDHFNTIFELDDINVELDEEEY